MLPKINTIILILKLAFSYFSVLISNMIHSDRYKPNEPNL